MKSTTIISGAAIVLSSFSNAAPTPITLPTDISKRSVTEPERRTPESEAEAVVEPTPTNSEGSVLVRTEVDDDFMKRTAQASPAPATNDTEISDACVIM